MDCACSVGTIYGESDDHRWGERKVNKAKKNHRCCECRVIIPKGSPFHYHTVFSEGSASNFKICPDCQCVIEKFFNNGWMFTSVWENLEDYLEENWSEDLPSSCISQLTPVARDKVCDILQKIHERDCDGHKQLNQRMG